MRARVSASQTCGSIPFFDERTGEIRGFTAGLRSEDPAVLAPDGDGSHRSFCCVIVQFQNAVVEISPAPCASGHSGLRQPAAIFRKYRAVESSARPPDRQRSALPVLAGPRPRTSGGDPRASLSSAESCAMRLIASSEIAEPWARRTSINLHLTCIPRQAHARHAAERGRRWPFQPAHAAPWHLPAAPEVL